MDFSFENTSTVFRVERRRHVSNRSLSCYTYSELRNYFIFKLVMQNRERRSASRCGTVFRCALPPLRYASSDMRNSPAPLSSSRARPESSFLVEVFFNFCFCFFTSADALTAGFQSFPGRA